VTLATPSVIDRFVVLADDLTGAHASAVRLRQRGIPVTVTWDTTKIPTHGAVVADLRTRDRPELAQTQVTAWAKALIASGRDRFELRVDTTLRGSPAAELDSLLTASETEDVAVIAVPAYPSAGRHTRGGMQVVDDGGLRTADLDVATLLFPGEVSQVIGRELTGGNAKQLEQRIRELCDTGVRRIVLDADTEEHLQTAAAAVDALHTSGQPVITVSSGAWLRSYPIEPSLYLIVYASPTPANAAQLAQLQRRVPEVVVVTAGDPHPEGFADGTVVVVETLSREGGDELAAVAAETAVAILEAGRRKGSRWRGAVVSGGHAASCLMDRLGASALEPIRETQPLCPKGILRGGSWDGLPIVTKGGRIGDDETLTALLNALQLP
jgi:D-threonate/D-erythronate kinase